MGALFWIFGAGAIVVALIAFARGRARNAGRGDGGLSGIWFDPTPADDLTRHAHHHAAIAAHTHATHGNDGESGHCHHDASHDCGGGDAGGCDGGGGDGGGGGD